MSVGNLPLELLASPLMSQLQNIVDIKVGPKSVEAALLQSLLESVVHPTSDIVVRTDYLFFFFLHPTVPGRYVPCPVSGGI